jgi:Fe-S-cluster containining protein
MKEHPGYENPTSFVCAMCGNCCRGEGYVRISPAEVEKIANYLGIGRAEFLREYTRVPEIEEQRLTSDVWLKDQPGPEQACIFLRENRCAIHEVKPIQCIGFPLRWRTPDVLEYCEGMRQ